VTIPLGILDQSPIRPASTAAEALGDSIALAQAAERLGYRRYWLAEHHSSPGLAGAAPEILIARIAAATTRLRIGSGGVMLSHYSPLKVAEQFRMLEALYPGRIDLGLGRAPGADWRTSQALAFDRMPRGPEQFPRQIGDLIGFLDDRIPNDHPAAGIHASPRAVAMPELWLLGSSDQSAMLAAYFGTAFAFAHFISAAGSDAAMEQYRANFRPSPWLGRPYACLAVFVICADTEAAADRLARSRDLWRLRLEQGRLGPVPTVEEAESHPYTDDERRWIAANRRRYVLGAPEQVKARLLALSDSHRADELMIVTITPDFASRLRSYELLAAAFEVASNPDG
jgi:luciferase family oxidoreductase group 1